MDEGRIQAMLARLREAVDTQHLPGAVVLLEHAGRTVCFEALGQQDPASGVPMQRDSIFRIFSMTKPVVSLAAMQLMEDGRLMLHEPVSRYLPEFAGLRVSVEQGGRQSLRPLVRPPTVQDLLRHTAGFTYEFLGSSAVQRAYDDARIGLRSRSNAEFCRELAQIPLAHQPGSAWEYSRATDVLGALVEKVADRPLREVLRQRIFAPLGMNETGFSAPASQRGRLAQAFDIDPDTGLARELELFDPCEVPAFESGGGGLVSTAADYARFLRMMLAGGTLDGARIASRATLQYMTSDHLGHIPALGELLAPGHGFGLGYAVRLHTGIAPGPGSAGVYFWSGIAGTSFFVDPAERLFAMLLTQAPGQRVFYRSLFRNLVYAAL